MLAGTRATPKEAYWPPENEWRMSVVFGLLRRCPMLLPSLLLLASTGLAADGNVVSASHRVLVLVPSALQLPVDPMSGANSWQYLPEPQKVSDVEGLGPVLNVASRGFKWGLFSNRMLTDLFTPGAVQPGKLGAEALLGASVQAQDTCLAQPTNLGERGVDPGSAARCPPPIAARPGTPLRIVPRLYREGRLGVAVVGTL
jgi:hypothetical protein